MAITTIKIYPPIGIARLGNSPDEYFIGSEKPGDRPIPPNGYKDAHCRIKRQAARFRLYAFDENGSLVQEITLADAAITWTVHLANKKAAWREFSGPATNTAFRNAGVADRSSLEIDPGPRTLTGPNQAAGFNTGKFLGQTVPLGEMRTEADGQLLVLGGFGKSASVPPGLPIPQYANNDGWHDDVADGPVTASVQLAGNTFVAVPAWVICAPPDFAPSVDSITTLYDTLLQVAVDKGLATAPGIPSFTHDIYPILRRVLDLARVSQLAGSGHFSFASAFPPGGTAAARQAIFNRIRDPNNPHVSGAANMPKLYGDTNQADQTITRLQYQTLKDWKDGNFIDDWTGSPAPPAATITPDGLSRAALEACVGGAFFPGIEGSWFLRDTYNYLEPFRLDHTGRAAGDVGKQMAVPWQADFYECLEDGDGLAWWPAQRPDEVYPETGGGPVAWSRDIIRRHQDVGYPTSHQDMVDSWHKLGFVVNKNGQVVETERHVTCQGLFFINDRSNFSQDEVAALLGAGSPAKFEDAFYVVAEGFTPADLNITHPNPTPLELAALAPSIVIRRSDNSLAPNIAATPQHLLLEDPALPATPQRFTFVYRVEFTDTSAFLVNGVPVETQPLTLTATKNNFTTTGALTLVHQPNPYMLDGPTSWLSTDVRVFKVTQGDAPFGPTVGAIGADATAASAFIKNVVQHFNAVGPINHPFDGLATDQQASWLELSEKVNNQRIFNFAVARVRFRGNVLDATDVRVFFRLFTTAATGIDYDIDSTYRRSGSPTAPVALLGLQGGEIVTIPCYGEPRKDTTLVALTAQTDDDFNRRNLIHAGANEVEGYFGCWLDFNQTTPRFPNQPTPANGPWTTGLRSIQELIRGFHQCLVAEVVFGSNSIMQGATPASSDQLSQRNLAIVESDNPGSASSRTVQHTFEIKSTRPAGRVVTTLERNQHEPAPRRLASAGADELLIRWNNVPRSTRVTLYLPSLGADEILRLAGQNYEAVRWERVDAHTLLCLPGDVSYLPIPGGQAKNMPALLTLELPEGIKRGQIFHATVHQVSGRPRTILGAFQLTIPVGERALLLEAEIRKLSVLRWIAQAIVHDDPWYPIFVRLQHQVGERVRGFGGEPERVAPAADGSGRCASRLARRWTGDLIQLNIPWQDCIIDGAIDIKIRFRK